MNTKYLIILAAVFIAVILMVPWVAKGLLVFLLIAILIVYFGKNKCFKVSEDVIDTIFSHGKKKLKEMTSRNIEETLTIHDVEQKELNDGTFAISIFTEKGKMTLKPRKFNTMPEVLQKGKKVVYKVVHTMENCQIVKNKTISAIGSDGEERIFQLEDN